MYRVPVRLMHFLCYILCRDSDWDKTTHLMFQERALEVRIFFHIPGCDGARMHIDGHTPIGNREPFSLVKSLVGAKSFLLDC